jgi:hypothetical protein
MYVRTRPTIAIPIALNLGSVAMISRRSGIVSCNQRAHEPVETDGDRWDWLVWRPGESPDEARHGVAASVQDAMRAAEGALGV